MNPTLVRIAEVWELPDGSILYQVHDGLVCRASGRHCVLHYPKPQALSDAQLIWRDDRNIFERICEHGVGHPDQSQSDYWKHTGRQHEGIHGCDGCCVSGETP